MTWRFIKIIRNIATHARLKLGQFYPGDGFAFRHAHSQGVRQHAFDPSGLTHRRKFNITFDPRQIEHHRLSPGLTPAIGALCDRNRAVGLNVEVANRERVVIENELVERPVASAPEQIKRDDRAE